MISSCLPLLMIHIFLTLDTQSLRHILKTCSVCENYSSLKLNLDKSQGCWIGAAKGKLDKPLECGWINIVKGKKFWF